ncbi:hypothetical protein ZHAS_00013387 [Anopheles sinensis]|uniref:Uncharacterized protein n=1 Tax=Anopheles sinensis TaxID=74873 RepID=A0A084W5F7_ANOSI|nr:hypothetical protein ZHAS_00013387 [Anopheles sinensis]
MTIIMSIRWTSDEQLVGGSSDGFSDLGSTEAAKLRSGKATPAWALRLKHIVVLAAFSSERQDDQLQYNLHAITSGSLLGSFPVEKLPQFSFFQFIPVCWGKEVYWDSYRPTIKLPGKPLKNIE